MSLELRRLVQMCIWDWKMVWKYIVKITSSPVQQGNTNWMSLHEETREDLTAWTFGGNSNIKQ